jgi:hypothetical protein
MSGQLGLGVGLSAGYTLVEPGASVMLKYWLSDSLAIIPQVQLKMSKQNDVDMSWAVSPSAIVAYCPWKTTSTRLSAGGGFGFTFAKWGGSPTTTPPATTTALPAPNFGQTPTLAPNSDMYIAVTLPIYVSMEHFFTKWFSMGIALQDDFLTYGKQGDAYHLGVSIDTVDNLTASGFLFFYTD